MKDLEVLYEDNHLIIVNKQAGTPVQEDATGDLPLVEIVRSYLKEKYQKPGNVFCGLIHRIDRPVSGITVLAKTSKALERMNALFQERAIDKVYWALVDKMPEPASGKLVHWLLKDSKNNRSKYFRKEVAYSKRAELDYQYVQAWHGHHLLEVKLYTGRHHQIRVQLSALGCPILGDTKYGSPESVLIGRIGLHARCISFEHPISKILILVEAPCPDNLVWS